MLVASTTTGLCLTSTTLGTLARWACLCNTKPCLGCSGAAAKQAAWMSLTRCVLQVGMRHYNIRKNKYFCPIINLDKLWTLVGHDVRPHAANGMLQH